jgi:hypothetical protein
MMLNITYMTVVEQGIIKGLITKSEFVRKRKDMSVKINKAKTKRKKSEF